MVILIVEVVGEYAVKQQFPKICTDLLLGFTPGGFLDVLVPFDCPASQEPATWLVCMLEQHHLIVFYHYDPYTQCDRSGDTPVDPCSTV